MKIISSMLLVGFLSVTTYGQDASDVLLKYFEAVGGKATIEKIQSIQSSITFVDYSGNKDTVYSESIQNIPYFSLSRTYSDSTKANLTSEYLSNEKRSVFRLVSPSFFEKYGEKREIVLTITHFLLKAFNESKIVLIDDDVTKENKDLAGVSTTFGKKELKDFNRTFYFDKTTGLLKSSSGNTLGWRHDVLQRLSPGGWVAVSADSRLLSAQAAYHKNYLSKHYDESESG
jgi:hypothetical protein